MWLALCVNYRYIASEEEELGELFLHSFVRSWEKLRAAEMMKMNLKTDNWGGGLG